MCWKYVGRLDLVIGFDTLLIMYEIYETKAYVLRSYGSGENDTRALFFTEDFGLI